MFLVLFRGIYALFRNSLCADCALLFIKIAKNKCCFVNYCLLSSLNN